MQEFKDAFGIEVDDDDPWYKEHPGEYKVVGYSPIGEELYYRPGINDDDDDDEKDRSVYTSHGSGRTYYETPACSHYGSSSDSFPISRIPATKRTRRMNPSPQV